MKKEIVLQPGDMTRYEMTVIDNDAVVYNNKHFTLDNLYKQTDVNEITIIVIRALLEFMVGNIKEHKKYCKLHKSNYQSSSLEIDIFECFV